MPTVDVEAAIIGAGPYGLSVAAHLRGRGVHARVFGDPMGTWRSMPGGMYLKSAPRASSISGPEPGFGFDDFVAAIGAPAMTDADAIPLDMFVQYGKWFQDRHVPDIEQELVTYVAWAGSGFEITLASGEALRCSTVVSASGVIAFAHLPRELVPLVPDGPSPEAAVSHSSQHVDFAHLAGKRVVVVGAGQSAMECATLLAEAGGQVELVARTDRLLWALPPEQQASQLRKLFKPRSDLGPGWSHRALADAPALVRFLPLAARDWLMANVLGPSGSFWLRDRFEDCVRVRLGRTVVGAKESGGRIRLDLGVGGSGMGTETLEADHVIAGTGYRIDLDRIDYLDAAMRARLRRTGRAPALGGNFESSVPGLYFTGLAAAPTFGPYLRFVAGTRFAAPRVAGAIARRLAQTSGRPRSG